MILEKINSPSDLKKLKVSELDAYSAEVKKYIIDVVSQNGGHLASSLGAVDLIIALHYAFDCPKDKLVFDVGHQAYAHKIITGRREEFKSVRLQGGLSGFPKISESECDAFTVGHSSTSISAALGLARARDLSGENGEIVAVIGDGAFTGGMAYEALEDLGTSNTKMLIILNDNSMSISKNVGGMSSYFDRLRLSRRYRKLEKRLKTDIDGLPIIGKHLSSALSKIKSKLRAVISSKKMFEQLGVKYFGVYDGHDISEMITIFNKVKNINSPVLLHFITKKGSGYIDAEQNPQKYHGLDAADATNDPKFSCVVSKALQEIAAEDGKIVGVSAAMLESTGLGDFSRTYPNRCYDVGIAEPHAVTMAAGLAASGFKPYFAVYSSFLQRAYDQLLHDVCLPDLPVRFLIDRAGAVGADGATHQGVFDLSFLSTLPNMTVLTPSSGSELYMMIKWSQNYPHPLAIRYPKSYSANRDFISDNPLKWELARSAKSGIFLLAVGGRMLELALTVSNVNVVNARCVKPLDAEFLSNIKSGSLIITIEDNILIGGFGSRVNSHLCGRDIKIINLGYPDKFIEEMNIDEAMQNAGLSLQNISNIIENFNRT